MLFLRHIWSTNQHGDDGVGVTDPAKLWNSLHSSEIEIVELKTIDDEILFVKWRYTKKGKELLAMTNVIKQLSRLVKPDSYSLNFIHTFGTSAL